MLLIVRNILSVIALLWLLVGAPVPAWAAMPADPGLDQQVNRCFELRRNQPSEAARIARKALPQAERDPARHIKLLSCLGQSQALAGHAAEALATVDRTLAELKSHPQPPAFNLRVYSNVAVALHVAGQLHRALDYYNLAYDAALAGDSAVAQVSTLINVAIIYSEELDAFDRAEDYFARAQVIADRAALSNPLLAYNRALNAIRAGRDGTVPALLDQAERLARDTDTQLVVARAQAERIALQARNGTGEQARPRLLDIARQQREAQDPSGASTTLVRVATLALADKDPAAALHQATTALQLARSGGFRTEQRDAMRVLLAAQQALGQYKQALATSAQLSDRQLQALRSQNLAGLAALQDRLDDTDRARELAAMRADQRVQALQLESARTLRNLAIAGFCVLALLSAGFYVYQRRVHAELERLSSTDAMTGMLNRRAANQRMAALPAPGDGRRHVAFLVDIDHFKDVNDLHGHEAGDALLVEIGRRLRTEGEPGDIVARWGGEEFLVARANVDPDRVAQIAEDMRACIADRAVSLPTGGAHRLTASIGFACWPFYPDAPAELRGDFHCALSLADRALYASKHGGRDAWTGLWGQAGQDGRPVRALDQPDAAEAVGQLRILTNRAPAQWHARAMAQD
ncbi:diguanylate cyclase (GGDEF) domain-containing protein [Pseudoxanthomonas sp. GM95]|uniref:GGDEF domain-containing protein n=1 Tax=Pseudoxanthomonas sp. GM95 TaxID=1881043 RepID=UPI0008BE1667|nr:GGDEF domain-containing protein [Pseudoxanthomonas sp. GM95]SEL05777.1 diguanylate cyclase (GGDEF) domain-containing protein [Pseudoxanthomonas sp. GM95]